ncbi:MAG: hypothetical protein GY870_16275 [archaeon]|nr:hypothetical protein [archaeon]
MFSFLDMLKSTINEFFIGLIEVKEIIEKDILYTESEMKIWIKKKTRKKLDNQANILKKIFDNLYNMKFEDFFELLYF